MLWPVCSLTRLDSSTSQHTKNNKFPSLVKSNLVHLETRVGIHNSFKKFLRTTFYLSNHLSSKFVFTNHFLSNFLKNFIRNHLRTKLQFCIHNIKKIT